MDRSDIREHMQVLASDGQRIGTVDGMEGANFIKLTQNDSEDGKHHWIQRDWVESMDGDALRLSMDAESVRDHWYNENPLGLESNMSGIDESITNRDR
jgi:hypothetical protein